FLAALLGVGGIADKVKKFFQALSKPVMKAVDWVVGKIVGFGKKIWAKLKDKFGKKKDGKPGDAKDDKAAQKAENPVVKVSFQMAGAPHTLTFKPETDDAKVVMASDLPDDLINKFSKAHVRIDNFRVYMESIEDPDVKKRFQENVLPWVEEFLHINVMRFRSIYKQWFPPREPTGGISSVRTEDKLTKVRGMTSEAQEALQNLTKWAAKTGITDLAPHEIERVFTAQGQEIWKADFEQKKAKIQAIVGKYSYKGQPVQYKGSMVTGWRGKHKGKTHYDPKDFDVDMYVVHAEEFERIKTRKRGWGKSWIAGDPIDAPELLQVSDRVAAELGDAFPGVKGIGESKIVLRKSPQ
ncbi:hypothetical protein, partial [Actinorhabdospora filicis]|uniref:hypothetical protein n=1 Tax=Actinorhabdospora filicis TaxID=1785913 RepID=UPI002554F881